MVYSHRPLQCQAPAACPIQFVMHGNSRTAQGYRDYWVAAANQHGFVVLAPEFTRAAWPGSRSYNQGDVAASDDSRLWAFSVVEHLFDEVRTSQTHYRIFGHSAGAQFVHRMMALLPDNRASQAVVANAGWYTLPEWREERTNFPWPHSLFRARVGEPGTRAALSKPTLILLGEDDTDTRDPDLDQSPGSQAQGLHRLARGLNYFEFSRKLATELGMSLPWRLVRVPHTGHSGRGMSEAAARELYGP